MNETHNDVELSLAIENDADVQRAAEEYSVQQSVAPSMHDAETVHADLAPYSLTREQVVEKYKAAGIDVKPRTISFYAKEGRLRAVKVEAKNGLERYVYDAASVEEDIALRKNYRQPDALYVGVTNDDARRVQEGAASISHGAKSEQGSIAHALHARADDKDIKIARLETALEIEQRERATVDRKLGEEINRSLSMARKIGEYETKIGHLQNQLALIGGPKAEPEA